MDRAVLCLLGGIGILTEREEGMGMEWSGMQLN